MVMIHSPAVAIMALRSIALAVCDSCIWKCLIECPQYSSANPLIRCDVTPQPGLHPPTINQPPPAPNAQHDGIQWQHFYFLLLWEDPFVPLSNPHSRLRKLPCLMRYNVAALLTAPPLSTNQHLLPMSQTAKTMLLGALIATAGLWIFIMTVAMGYVAFRI
jgi:hypothetical protein